MWENTILWSHKLFVTKLLPGATDFTITEERSKVIRLSEPLLEYYNSVFAKRPGDGLHITAYTDPLTKYSWTMITVFCLVSPMLLFITIRSALNFYHSLPGIACGTNILVSDWAKGMKTIKSSPSPNPTFSQPLLQPWEDGALIHPHGQEGFLLSGNKLFKIHYF